MNSKKRIWFGPKQLGVGMSPSSIEGWIVTILFAAAAIAWQRLLGHQGMFAFGLIGLAVAYGGIVWLTYGKQED